MDANHQHLPYDVVELVIDFASEPFIWTTSRNTVSKHILLVCALVCKTWLWPARRRLLSLCFKLGVVKLDATPKAFLYFHEVFNSPLCTLDSAFIRRLKIKARLAYSKAFVILPFSTLLSILTEISLPSLHTIRFRDIYPIFNSFNIEIEEEDSSTCYSVTPVSHGTLSQVRKLVFSASQYGPSALGFIAKTTRYFPCLESLTVTCWFGAGLRLNGNSCFFRPPQSLRKLVVDTLTCVGLVAWLATCGHANISLLLLQDGKYMVEGAITRLLLALDTLGCGLEEFELGLDFYASSFELNLTFIYPRFIFQESFQRPWIRVQERYTSIKQLILRVRIPMLANFLPHLFDLLSSLSRLQTLEFVLTGWGPDESPYLKKLQRLDEYIQSSRPSSSLGQVIFRHEDDFGGNRWDESEAQVKIDRPYCVKTSMIEFRK